jgi:hypothetical protein
MNGNNDEDHEDDDIDQGRRIGPPPGMEGFLADLELAKLMPLPTSLITAPAPGPPHCTAPGATLIDIPTNDPSPSGPSSRFLFKEQATSPQTAGPRMTVLYCPLH